MKKVLFSLILCAFATYVIAQEGRTSIGFEARILSSDGIYDLESIKTYLKETPNQGHSLGGHPGTGYSVGFTVGRKVFPHLQVRGGLFFSSLAYNFEGKLFNPFPNQMGEIFPSDAPIEVDGTNYYYFLDAQIALRIYANKNRLRFFAQPSSKFNYSLFVI